MDRSFPFWVLYWNDRKGGGLITETTVEMDPQFCYLIPPHTAFSSVNSNEFDHFYCHFRVSGYFERVRRKIYSFPAVLLCENLPLLQNNTYPNEKKLFHLHRLLSYYLMEIREDCFLPPGRPRLDPGIATAVRTMDEDLTVNPPNRELARKAGMSLKNFYDTFSRNMGLTPKRYLFAQRMELARQLLLHSDLSPEEIAERTGYADRFHFSKAFKHACGLAPVTFRKKYGKVQ